MFALARITKLEHIVTMPTLLLSSLSIPGYGNRMQNRFNDKLSVSVPLNPTRCASDDIRTKCFIHEKSWHENDISTDENEISVHKNE